jgi:hypothetical protein
LDFILFCRIHDFILYLSCDCFISAATGAFGFYFGVFSVDRSFSVRPNLGRVGFSCGNQEKLSVSTLNKLGFVNDVEGFVGVLEAGSLHGEPADGLLHRHVRCCVDQLLPMLDNELHKTCTVRDRVDDGLERLVECALYRVRLSKARVCRELKEVVGGH